MKNSRRETATRLVVPITWEDWCEPREDSFEPCGHPDPELCDCKGACSCHWVEIEIPADLPGLWDGVPLDGAGRLLVGFCAEDVASGRVEDER